MTEKEIQWLQVFIERPVEEVTGADVDHAHGIMDGILREGNGTVEFGGLEHKLLHDAGDKINRWNITRELRVQQERRHSAALWNTKEKALNQLIDALQVLATSEAMPPTGSGANVPNEDDLRSMTAAQLEVDLNQADALVRKAEASLERVSETRELLTKALKGEALRSVTSMLDAMKSAADLSMSTSAALADALRGEHQRRISEQVEAYRKADLPSRVDQLEAEIARLIKQRDAEVAATS